MKMDIWILILTLFNIKNTRIFLVLVIVQIFQLQKLGMQLSIKCWWLDTIYTDNGMDNLLMQNMMDIQNAACSWEIVILLMLLTDMSKNLHGIIFSKWELQFLAELLVTWDITSLLEIIDLHSWMLKSLEHMVLHFIILREDSTYLVQKKSHNKKRLIYMLLANQKKIPMQKHIEKTIIIMIK